jgi:hypothetical protein
VKKILFISLALIMALSVGLVGCAGGGGGGGGGVPTTIKVGAVRDLTGVLAFYDQFAGGPVYRAFNKTVNSGGGIFMSVYNKTLPIEVKVRPYDPMTPGDLGTQTIASITSDKVHFMWGGPGTTTIYTQAAICDAYGMLLMTLEGGATDMMAEPGKLDSWANTFINLSFSDWYELPVMYKALQAEGISYPKAYVLYIDNEHGNEYLNVTKQLFGAANVTAEGHDQYSADQSAITTIVNHAITALNQSGSGPDYDIFCAYTYDPFLGYVMVAFNDTGFDPPGIIMGPGAQGGAYLMFYGAWMEGIMGFAVANNKTVISQTTTMSLNTMYNLIMAEVATGYPPAAAYDPWGDPTLWAGLEMWKKAVETVGHLDMGYTGLVRNVLAGYNQTNPCTTVIGDAWYTMFGGGYGGGVMDYMCMPGQIGQWQNSYLEIIGYTGVTTDIPKYSATSTLWYPMTGNWTWL